MQMMRGLPWAVHVNGMTSLARERNVFSNTSDNTKNHMYMIGILDMPTHTLGRKMDYLHVWYDHCRFQSGLEDYLGLPCSSVDLLCSITQPDIEQRLLTWQSEAGTAEECAIWDLTRHTGILMAYNYRIDHVMDGKCCGMELDLIIVSMRHILTTVHSLRTQHGTLVPETWSNLSFPLAAAGSLSQALTEDDKILIHQSISDLANGSLDVCPYYQKASMVLHELWENACDRSIQQMARDLDVEIALF